MRGRGDDGPKLSSQPSSDRAEEGQLNGGSGYGGLLGELEVSAEDDDEAEVEVEGEVEGEDEEAAGEQYQGRYSRF